jgi:hypothetical protein
MTSFQKWAMPLRQFLVAKAGLYVFVTLACMLIHVKS